MLLFLLWSSSVFPGSSLGGYSVCYNRNSLRPAPVLLGNCIAQISSASFHALKVSTKKRRVKLLMENKKISLESLYKGPKALLGYTSVLTLTSYCLPIFCLGWLLWSCGHFSLFLNKVLSAPSEMWQTGRVVISPVTDIKAGKTVFKAMLVALKMLSEAVFRLIDMV